jgi:hypothetical protein
MDHRPPSSRKSDVRPLRNTWLTDPWKPSMFVNMTSRNGERHQQGD